MKNYFLEFRTLLQVTKFLLNPIISINRGVNFSGNFRRTRHKACPFELYIWLWHALISSLYMFCIKRKIKKNRIRSDQPSAEKIFPCPDQTQFLFICLVAFPGSG